MYGATTKSSSKVYKYEPDLSVGYLDKRDRWTGYNPSQYTAVIEEANRQIRAGKLTVEENDKQHLYKDEDKYMVEVNMPGTKADSKQRISVRNLRITEDAAKYLRKAHGPVFRINLHNIE